MDPDGKPQLVAIPLKPSMSSGWRSWLPSVSIRRSWAHLEGRTLLKMGDCIGQIYPERGIARVRQALPLIDVSREPRLELCARHDLAWFLNSGKPEGALAVLDRARRVYP